MKGGPTPDLSLIVYCFFELLQNSIEDVGDRWEYKLGQYVDRTLSRAELRSVNKPAPFRSLCEIPPTSPTPTQHCCHLTSCSCIGTITASFQNQFSLHIPLPWMGLLFKSTHSIMYEWAKMIESSIDK